MTTVAPHHQRCRDAEPVAGDALDPPFGIKLSLPPALPRDVCSVVSHDTALTLALESSDFWERGKLLEQGMHPSVYHDDHLIVKKLSHTHTPPLFSARRQPTAASMTETSILKEKGRGERERDSERGGSRARDREGRWHGAASLIHVLGGPAASSSSPAAAGPVPRRPSANTPIAVAAPATAHSKPGGHTSAISPRRKGATI